MKDLKGTKTEKNLQEAFAGESKARNKYTYYASKARKDGYEQIAAIFEETANNEKEHAKLWFKYLEGGDIKDTLSNLNDAAAGENYEWTDMYGATASSWAISRTASCSLATATASGSAATAVISSSAPRPRRYAPSALIRRASSRSTLRTIKP